MKKFSKVVVCIAVFMTVGIVTSFAMNHSGELTQIAAKIEMDSIGETNN